LVFDNLERLSRLTATRRQQDLYCACLYDDSEFASIVQGSQAIGEFTPQTMTTNIVRRQVDAFVTRHTKNRPVPMALTNGGTYSEQRRAKALSKMFEGVLDEVGYWDKRPMLRRDGAIFGDGLAWNYRVGGKLFHDRTYPWEWFWNPRAAMYGRPQELFLLRYIDRLVMMERFPKFAEEILNAEGKSDLPQWEFNWDECHDDVLVAAAWRLPSTDPKEKDAKGGSYALCVSNATLEHSEYRRDYHPISNWKFSPGLVGWRGDGMAWGLRGLQYEVNAVGLRLQEQGYMTGTVVWTPPDSGLEAEMIDNGVWTHLTSAVQPVFHNPAPWHPAFFDWYMSLRGRFPAEETRLSEMATRGEKPMGLDSGKALRAWDQIDDEAFVPQAKEDERDSIDTAWQFFDLLEEIHEEGSRDPNSNSGYRVQVEKREYGSSVLEEYSYDEVRMDREKFILRVFPTSLLTGTPAEKYQTVKELMADGLFSQDEAYALIDIPDVQRILNLRGASRRYVEKLLEKILNSSDPSSDFVSPEPAMNLELCRALALMTYLDASANDAAAENLKWVLQFALEAELELESQEDAAAAQQGPPPGPGDMGLPPEAGAAGPGPLFAEPEQQPLPGGAMAPEAMAPVPGVQ
jgi:hypothetical protein